MSRLLPGSAGHQQFTKENLADTFRCPQTWRASVIQG